MKALDYPTKEDEKGKDLGRLNFFLINQTNFFIKDFLKVNILDNCIFVLLIDLEKHQNLQGCIKQWINFLEQELEAYFRQCPLDERKEVLEQFKLVNEKLHNLAYKGEFLTGWGDW